MPSLARPSLISAAVIALPLSLMAARGNHKELIIGRKAVHPLPLPAVGLRCLALFCMCFQPKEKHMHDQNRNYECPELALLVAHMSEKGYRRRVIVNYKTIARQFLRYLRHLRISIDAV
jgi:hypothetical protein